MREMLRAFPKMERLFCAHDDICGVARAEVAAAVASFGAGEKRVVPGGGEGPFAEGGGGGGAVNLAAAAAGSDAEGKGKEE